MAGRLLGMGDVVGLVEKAQEVIDEKEAERAARKMQKGSFNFDDFLKQMNMIRKMGPLKKVLGMLPGVGAMLKDVDLDNQDFARMEAIMLSMTRRERRRPEIIDIQRRRRIARGSGNDLDRVNALMKQFKTMQKLMKSLGKGGMPDLSALEGMGGGMPGPGGMGMPGLGGGGMPKGFPGLPGGGLGGFRGKRKR
jgi:signal recognition particle subunit SRP54